MLFNRYKEIVKELLGIDCNCLDLIKSDKEETSKFFLKLLKQNENKQD